mgnify:CR=1 FL=1
MTNTCARCGRKLKDPTAEYGPICARKVAAEQALAEQQAANITIPVTIRDGYAGTRTPDGSVVVRIRNGVQEPLRHLVHHSPTGFEWGYGGSGPADLARSIIADALGIIDPAIYQEFKREFVAGWGDRWEISLEQVRAWAEKRAAAQ